MALSFDEAIKEVNWEKLENQYRFVIAGNTASVFVRRWFLPDKLLLTAVAFLGTKAIDVKISIRDGLGSSFETDTFETLTDLNVAWELKRICMIFLGHWTVAQKMVEEE